MATKSASEGAGRRLVIVESPAKARTIAGYLGPEFAVEAAFVVPINPFSGRELDIVDAHPGAAVANEFSFVERVQRLGHRIVIRLSG